MTDAQLLGEAIATTITLARAYAVWLILLAVVASLLLLAAIATVAWTARAAWRGVTAAVRRAQGRRAPQGHRAPVRASDGHTADPRYEEAA